MIRRLGNILLLAGILCLGLFFTSNTFLFDASWFFLGGVGGISLGLLFRRRRKKGRSRRRAKPLPGNGKTDENP